MWFQAAHFGKGPAEHGFGCGVDPFDVALDILHDDGVAGVIEDRAEKCLRLGPLREGTMEIGVLGLLVGHGAACCRRLFGGQGAVGAVNIR